MPKLFFSFKVKEEAKIDLHGLEDHVVNEIIKICIANRKTHKLFVSNLKINMKRSINRRVLQIEGNCTDYGAMKILQKKIEK